jgi:hypothetical protein
MLDLRRRRIRCTDRKISLPLARQASTVVSGKSVETGEGFVGIVVRFHPRVRDFAVGNRQPIDRRRRVLPAVDGDRSRPLRRRCVELKRLGPISRLRTILAAVVIQSPVPVFHQRYTATMSCVPMRYA